MIHQHLFRLLIFPFLMFASVLLGNPPNVNTLEPFVGPTAGGNTVTLVGTNFSDGMTIKFGSKPVDHITILSDTTLSAVVPPGVPGTVPICITSPNGSYPTSSLYTYQGDSLAFWMNEAEGTISTVDMTTKEALKTIFSIEMPQSIAITPDGTKAYVTDFNHDSIIAIDIATQQVESTIVSQEFKQPKAIAITPDGREALVTNVGTNSITPLNLTVTPPLVEKAIAIDIPPREVIISPDGQSAYILDQELDHLSNAKVVLIDMATKKSESSYNLEEALELDEMIRKSSGVMRERVDEVLLAERLHSDQASKPNDSLDLVANQKIAMIPDQSPVALFTATIGPVGTVSSFDASSSRSPISSIALYEWDFGDGMLITTSEAYTNHCYASAGSYCVTLKVTNSKGTSTQQEFIGSFLEKNGGPLAVATKMIEVITPPMVSASPDACNTTTTKILSVTPNPVCQGANVQISASVTPSISLNGKLTFSIGTTTLCSIKVNSAGTATCIAPVGAPFAGPQTVTVAYGGDTNNNCDSSTTFTLFVATPTTTQASAIPNPACEGQSVIFSTTVFPTTGTATPTGHVAFSIGSTPLCMAQLAGGSGSCMATVTAIGAQTVTAAYNGDNNNCASSTTFTLNVGTPTTTTASANPNPTCEGQSVVFSTTVTPTGSFTPTGMVTFLIGSTPLCHATLDASGNGSCTTPVTTPVGGPQTVTAKYGGDDHNCPSNTTFTLTVGSLTTTIASASLNPVCQEETVTFSATVSSTTPGTPTPTGTVRFSIGSTTLCTATLDASGSGGCNSAVTTAGSQTVIATYSGDDNNCSSSTTFTLNVGTPTTTTASANPNPACKGNKVTFSATVTPTAGSPTPTGKVTFSIGSITLCSPTLIGGTGTCTVTVPTSFAGPQTVTVNYGGDDHNCPSSTTFTLDEVAPTTTTASASPNPACQEETVTFSATVTPSGSFTPTGTVRFSIGSTTLCTATLDASGSGSCNSAVTTPGSQTVTATYSGDDNNCSSSTTFTLNVGTPTTTNASASPNPACDGNNVAFSATVIPTGSFTPTGTVTFSIGSTTLCTAPLNGAGTGLCMAVVTTIGARKVTATYSGDANNCPSSTTFILDDGSPTTTTAAASPNTPCAGQTVKLSATVTPTGSSTPTGTVTFFIGSTTLCTAILDATGMGSCNSTVTTNGPQTVTAMYSGDIYNCPSSTTFTLNVSATTTITASASPNPLCEGQPVTFFATVTPTTGSPTPTGTVTFSIGSMKLCTATLSGGAGSCTATVATTGTQIVTSTYSGDANYCPSSTTFTVNVGTPTTINASASPKPICAGQPVTLSATVIPTGSSTPTGTVTFSIGCTTLCTATLCGGSGSCITCAIPSGTQTITAIYSGDDHNCSSRTTFTQVVGLFVRDAKVVQKIGRLAHQTERVNILTWKAPLDFDAVTYKIFRDSALKQQIGVIQVDQSSSHGKTFKFKDHNRKKNQTYTYYIIGIDVLGNETCPFEIIFRGEF